MTVRGRYAPSPTGPLHLGNLRTALLAWLQARVSGGEILLRFDDLDAPRQRPGAMQQIIDDLCWLGLEFDGEPLLQSQRTALYLKAFNQLVQDGRLFPCSCSRKDIELAASAPDRQSPRGRYPGTCRPDSGQRQDDRTGATRPHAWRFQVSSAIFGFDDIVVGSRQQNLEHDVGDFVVRRKDGVFAYQLASVVDDIEMGITDVVRGDDLLDSTPRQLALFEALGASPPAFWHVPLMLDPGGQKLSKRDGANSLQQLRARGVCAETVIGELASSLGLCDKKRAISADTLRATTSEAILKAALQR